MFSVECSMNNNNHEPFNSAEPRDENYNLTALCNVPIETIETNNENKNQYGVLVLCVHATTLKE